MGSEACMSPVPAHPAQTQPLLLLLFHSPREPHSSNRQREPRNPQGQSKWSHGPLKAWHCWGIAQSTAEPGTHSHPAACPAQPGACNTDVSPHTSHHSSAALLPTPCVLGGDADARWAGRGGLWEAVMGCIGSLGSPGCPHRGAQEAGLGSTSHIPRPGCLRVTGDLEREHCGGCASHGLGAQHGSGSLPRNELFMLSAPTALETHAAMGWCPPADLNTDWQSQCHSSPQQHDAQHLCPHAAVPGPVRRAVACLSPAAPWGSRQCPRCQPPTTPGTAGPAAASRPACPQQSRHVPGSGEQPHAPHQEVLPV